VSRRLKLKVEGVVFAILHGAQQSSFVFFFFVLVPLRLAAACQPYGYDRFAGCGQFTAGWAAGARTGRSGSETAGCISSSQAGFLDPTERSRTFPYTTFFFVLFSIL